MTREPSVPFATLGKPNVTGDTRYCAKGIEIALIQTNALLDPQRLA